MPLYWELKIEAPVSALLSYIMPVFRQSGRAFATGVSVRPKWLGPESFAASSGAEGSSSSSSRSCSLELALTVHSSQVPVWLQTNKQQPKRAENFSFFFPPLSQQQTVYAVQGQVWALRCVFPQLQSPWRDFLVREQVRGCCMFFLFVTPNLGHN